MGETFQYFKNQTLIELQNKLQNYSLQARLLYQEITTKETFYEQIYAKQQQLYNQLNTSRNRPWEQGSFELQQVESQLIEARNNLQLNKLYLDGYRLLNEIGEYFHQTWDYSVTLFGETSYTFQMGMEDFLSISHATVEGFRLNNKASILEAMKTTQIKNVIQWDTKESRKQGYNTQMFKNYNYAIDRAKSILSRGKASTINRFTFNAGERLEGYLAYIEKGQIYRKKLQLEQIHDIAYRKAIKHLGNENFNILRDQVINLLTELNEQTNTRGFWSGGDTAGHGQIKGENASVFSFSTIRNQLLRISVLFNNINFDKLLEKRKDVKNLAIQNLDKKTQEIINEVISAFDVSSIIGKNKINLLDEINQIIDQLV